MISPTKPTNHQHRTAATIILTISLLFGPCGCEKPKATTPDKPTITFWTTEGYQPEEVALLKELATAFEAKTNTHVAIEFFTWEEINSKYLAALSANKPPNIGQHGPDLPLRFSKEGLLTSADDIIASVGKDRFFPEFLDAVCRMDNHYWSVPWYVEVRSLLVRKDWLAETNLPAPKTWDDWLQVCKAMTKDTDGDGNPDRWGFGLYGRDNMGQTWVSMAAQNGGGLFDKNGKITVNAQPNAEALQWYCDLYLKHEVTPPGTKSATWVDANAYYKRGLVGTLVTNGYIINEMRKETPDILDQSIYVPMPARRKGGQSISYMGGSHLMLFKDAPNADKAAEFIKFLLDKDNYLRFLKSTSGGTLPALRDVCTNSFFQDDPNLKVLVAQIDGAIRHGYPAPPNPAVGAAEGEHVFGAVVHQVISGTKSAQQALDEAQARTEKIFEQQQAAQDATKE